MNKMRITTAVIGVLGLTTFSRAAEPIDQSYAFGPGALSGEHGIRVTSAEGYDAGRGFGFEAGRVTVDANRVATGDGPFMFSIKLPEGDYRVTAVLGGTPDAADTAVKAETRRIMTPLVKTAGGETKTVDFVVNVRVPTIDGGSSVNLSPREKLPSVRHWDDRLELEFCGQHPAVSSLQIRRVDHVTTLYLAGDSTVTDQPGEPWAAWGQVLPMYFGTDVVVANYAESGKTLKSFKNEHRLDKLLSLLKAGDYVFIQFGHNDMKEKGDGVGPYTSFSASLRDYVAAVRAKGATPVLLTPMHRRKFVGNEIQPTFGDYPDAVRKVAAELKTPLIDLQAMSKPLYEAFGPEKSKVMFVWAAANSYPNQDKDLKDDTHFRLFGANEIARCVIEGMRDAKLPLADKLRPGLGAFDPAHPDDPATFDIPASGLEAAKTPEGR